MNVEFTGRQYVITPAIRKQVESGLNKLRKILGQSFDTHVVLATEKKRHIAEITVTVRSNSMVGAGEAPEMMQAVGEAIDKLDRQAVRYKSRFKTRKRNARKASASTRWNGDPAAGAQPQAEVTDGGARAVDVVVHSFPGAVRLQEAHIIRSNDSVALRPMTIEEAVKEAEFRDREVFVFRDPEGKAKVLHRKKDGKMELIEVP